MCYFPLGEFPIERRMVFTSPFWFGNLEYSFLCQQYLEQCGDFSVFKSSHHMTHWWFAACTTLCYEKPPSKAYWKLLTAMESYFLFGCQYCSNIWINTTRCISIGHEPISRNIAHNSNLVKIYLTSTLMLVILIVLQILCEMMPVGQDISRWDDGGKYVIEHMLRLTYHVILTFTCDLDTKYLAQILKHDFSKPQ